MREGTPQGYVSRVLVSLLRILLGVAIAYGALLLLAWRFQNRMALPGARMRLVPPAQAGLPDGEIVDVTTADGVRLRGWYLAPSPDPRPGRPAPGLLWFYGNMETVTGLAPIVRWLRPPDIALLILDYRGYGESEGSPSEQGLYADADAAWAYLSARPEVDASRIAVYGRSVGAVPALHLATTRPVRAVALESAFSSAADMARVHYRMLPSFIVRLSMNNLERAARLTAPLLVFHGTEDAIALPRMGRAVAEAGHARELVLIRGAGHNETYDVGGEAYKQKLHQFLQEVLR
ncbi:MAG: alpha/beta hydrolase [Gemmatimonadetes bacterium]|nr:alpha/beta hydrolase [Gemmatimonadota bacterium]